MIIARIRGGLGNQMFQFAAGRALSLELEQSLRLDISAFAGYGSHQNFELQRVFDCPIEIASDADLRQVLGWQSSSGMRRVLSRPSMAAFRREGFVAEPHFHYWSGIRKIRRACYLAGYWQSEKYFLEAAAQIRADFSFRVPPEKLNADWVRQISQVNAVSLHVRRGDYANNPQINATHGLCSLEYYRTAIQHVAERVEDPHFLVFSDDVEWTRKNLKINVPLRYVEHNRGAEDYNDMRLMSTCKHHIIANSSFSWWGAWLNPSVNKIVVAPKRWFANQTDVGDLLPPGWVTL